jgi:glycosyltransferase involved in cell wall biosynthesis
MATNKILRIINRLNIGGPTYNAVYLSKYLAPEYETLLVAGMKDDTEGDSSYIAREHGLEPVFIPDMRRNISPLADWRGYHQVQAIVRAFKPHIVHTHAAKAGALGRLAAAANGVPVIVHTFHGHVFHSYFGPLKTRAFIEAERYLARKSAAIVAISETQKQELSEVYKICPPQKIAVVPNGFDLSRFMHNQPALREQFRNQFGIRENEVAIGIVGRLVPIKNHRLFLEAFAQVRAGNPQARAVIIGDGELRAEIEQQAHALGLTIGTGGDAQVVFTSWVLDVERAYAGLDVVALTSLNEGTPVSLIEAQAAAKPVVSTRVGGVADVVRHNETGCLVPSGDVQALAAALQQLVQSPVQRNDMGLAGRQWVEQRFGYQRLVKDMAALYDRLLQQATLRR